VRIVSTLTYYHPHWTGLSVVARSLAEGLAARGHSVTVLASRHDRTLREREQLNGVTVKRVPTVGRVSRAMVMPSFPLRLIRELPRADIVHIHTPMAEAALVAVVSRMLRKPTLITHHGDVVMPAGFGNRLIKLSMDAVIRGAMRLSDRVVVYVADYRDHSVFLAPLSSRIDSIYPPVDLPHPQPEHVERWRGSLGLQRRRLVGFAGRFVEEKGFDFLLEAVPLVRAQMPSVQFVYAGDTAIKYERFFERCLPLLARHREAITELGFLPDPQDMANFYALCDVFVLPSRTDCFAIVQVEALLSGTPLVTSNIPGAREVVRATGAGTLVRAGDPPALAEGILRVLKDPDRYRPDDETVKEVFDAQQSIGQYEELMLELVKQRRAPRQIDT
jgi:glycosyltransferase involved in cell wall biosynthesis